MIKYIKNLLRGHSFEVGQVVTLTRPFEYLGYLPVTFDLIPAFWIVTDLLDHGRIKIRISPISEDKARHEIEKQKRRRKADVYFPDHLDVEPKHLELAPDIIQILYGKNYAER